ncbi:S-layer region-like protein [Planktothrix tepida]|uniref:S-layer region-like protein n=1 Tax=Planktothrix tepida PCC 9214 TaxID=671072 RepID=A0A1J1LLC5_9CYAN|nr:S-layer homology domain-containing protein [Planktothrix tepida]CAD5938615.1 S-layer region-like protein [Planktothrix tepida]CUR33267.1 S-layer region-like protein [Planktothrix tepida PCC 9214]
MKQIILILSLITSLSACANSPTGKAIENSLKADPLLQTNTPAPQATTAPVTNPKPSIPPVELPSDFPSEIPPYPNATLQTVMPPTPDSTAVITLWETTDPSNVVQAFYQKELKAKNWKIIENSANENNDNLSAEKDNLKLTIAQQPNPQSDGKTYFQIRYQPLPVETVSSPTPTPTSTPTSTPTPTPTSNPEKPNNNSVPKELSPLVSDVAKLGIFKAPNSQETGTLPDPNGKITRSQYARWIVDVNNQLYANNPAKQIRLAVPSSDPVFTDVPTTHPNFAEIQGLAEAGLIPSPLSGDNTVTKFRPDSSLTREDLIRWKVPLDTRQALPKASLDAVKERWGFKDTSKIDAGALPAILEDYNNGDNSNIRRVFGFTTLFQPKKNVTRAEAAATLWFFGFQGEGISAQDALTDTPKPQQN